MFFTALIVAKLDINEKKNLWQIKQNFHCLQKADDSSNNNNYDKKSYSVFQPPQLSLIYLSLLTPALCVVKNTNNPNLTHSAHVHFCFQLESPAFIRQTSTEPRKNERKTIKGKFHLGFNDFFFLFLAISHFHSLIYRLTNSGETILYYHVKNLYLSIINV